MQGCHFIDLFLAQDTGLLIVAKPGVLFAPRPDAAGRIAFAGPERHATAKPRDHKPRERHDREPAQALVIILAPCE